MKNLKPKIEKVLVKTINEHYDFYKAYAENDKILVEWKDPDMNKNGPEEWFFVPDYDHEEEFCFTCDGGHGWDAMNPYDADYPDYDFEVKLDKNFEKAGLFCEPYASLETLCSGGSSDENIFRYGRSFGRLRNRCSRA